MGSRPIEMPTADFIVHESTTSLYYLKDAPGFESLPGTLTQPRSNGTLKRSQDSAECQSPER